MEKFNSILYDFAKKCGIKDLKIDNGYCCFDIGDAQVHVKYEQKRNKMILISEIAELPQTNSSSILRYFLRINGSDELSKGMTFGYNKESNKITVGYMQPLRFMTSASFDTKIRSLAIDVQEWAKLIEEFRKGKIPDGEIASNDSFHPEKEKAQEKKPIKVISDPLIELPNWIQAPIPYYTPAPVYKYVKINDLVSVYDSCLNVSNPETPTLINTLTNAIVYQNGQIIMPSFYYLHRSNFNSSDIHNLEVIDQAIPFFHMYLYGYYHFLIETLPLLICFGPKILNNSVILHNRHRKRNFKEICSLLNIKFKRSIYMGKPVFVKKLYITNPHPFIEYDSNALRHLRYLLITKCNASNIPASEYVYYNRRKNRLILNFNEMQKEIKREFPTLNFIQPTFDSVASQVIFWRKTKFVMMIHGSTFSNLLFMHPNTAYLEFCTIACRNAAVKMCKSLGIRVFEVMFKNHCLNKSMYVDLPVLIPAVKTILKLLETQNLDLF